MKNLILGEITNLELADWFGLTYGSFRGLKKKKMLELKKFCDFEETKHGIIVKEVFVDTYIKNFDLIDLQNYYNIVKKTPDYLTSISAISKTLSHNKDYENLSERSIEYRMRKAGNAAFGETKDANSHGTYGSREYVWAIKTYEPSRPYRFMTDEEQQLFNALTSQIYASEPEKIQKRALLDQQFKDTDMTKDEYFEKIDSLELNSFNEVIWSFREQTGLQVAKATKHEIEVGAF